MLTESVRFSEPYGGKACAQGVARRIETSFQDHRSRDIEGGSRLRIEAGQWVVAGRVHFVMSGLLFHSCVLLILNVQSLGLIHTLQFQMLAFLLSGALWRHSVWLNLDNSEQIKGK